MTLHDTRARLLDGAAVAADVRAALPPRIAAFASANGRPPTLGVLLAGSDPGSEVYVRGKIKQSEGLGMADRPATLARDRQFRRRASHRRSVQST